MGLCRSTCAGVVSEKGSNSAVVKLLRMVSEMLCLAHVWTEVMGMGVKIWLTVIFFWGDVVAKNR